MEANKALIGCHQDVENRLSPAVGRTSAYGSLSASASLSLFQLCLNFQRVDEMSGDDLNCSWEQTGILSFRSWSRDTSFGSVGPCVRGFCTRDDACILGRSMQYADTIACSHELIRQARLKIQFNAGWQACSTSLFPAGQLLPCRPTLRDRLPSYNG